ncbi:MAG: hypothetical protein ACRDJN_20425, partial [Chloroflexota bacterium]
MAALRGGRQRQVLLDGVAVDTEGARNGRLIHATRGAPPDRGEARLGFARGTVAGAPTIALFAAQAEP